MLVLARRPGQTIVIGDRLFVSLVDILPGAVNLATFDSFVRSHSVVRVEEGRWKQVAPRTWARFCGIGQNGSVRLGIDTALSTSVHRKEIWDVLRGHGS